MKSKEELKKLFENGDIPKQEDFWEWQDSYLHKEEKISQDSIEGLSLDSKLDKPVSTGNFFVINDGNSTSYEAISPSSDYLPYWDGNNFKSSLLYQNTVTNKMGLGTSEPSEQLHLSGKAKMSALVLDENPEESPYQITYNNRKFYGADSTGTKKQFMYATISDMTSSMFSATDIEKDAWRLAQRKTDESYSLGQPRIDMVSPPIINGSDDKISYVNLIGINLFLNNTQTNTAKVTMYRVTDEFGNAIIPTNDIFPNTFVIENISVYQSNPNTLSFGINFSTYPKGEYKFKVIHNNLVSISSPILAISSTTVTTKTPALTWEKYLDPNTIDTADIENNHSVFRRFHTENPQGTASQILKTVKSSVIIPASDVLKGFMMEFSVSVSGETYASWSYGNFFRAGLDYNSDIDAGFIPSIMFGYGFAKQYISNGAYINDNPNETTTIEFKVIVVVRNGICTIYMYRSNTLKVLTTFSFEQKNEPLYFYSSYYGTAANQWTVKSGLNITIPNNYITF